MKLINNTKSTFVTSKGNFLIGKILDFNEEEARTLLRYEGISSIESLEEKTTEVKTSKKKDK